MNEECWLCMGAHDSEFHASARRILSWILRRIDLAQTPVPVAQRGCQPFPGMGDVQALRCPASKRKAARK